MNKIILQGSSLSLNHMYGHRRSGGRFLTPEGKRLKEGWGWQAKSLKKQLCTEGVVVEVKLYFPDKRRRDSQNFLKLVYDAFSGILYADDSLIVEEHIYKFIDKNNPRIEFSWGLASITKT